MTRLLPPRLLIAKMLSCAITLCAVTRVTYALDPAYLNELPSAQRVRDQIRGADEMDTMARLDAAFYLLRESAAVMAGPDCHIIQRCPPDVSQVFRSYDAARSEIQYVWLKKAAPQGPQRVKWFAATWRYQSDAGFRNEVFQTFFSPAMRTMNQRAVEAEEKYMAGVRQENAQATTGRSTGA